MKKHRNLYLAFLSPLFLWIILCEISRVSFDLEIHLILAHLWCFILIFPGLAEKVEAQKYRFAFLRMVWSYYNFLLDLKFIKNRRYKHFFARLLGPVTFSILTTFILHKLTTQYVLLGCFVFEVTRFVVLKYFPAILDPKAYEEHHSPEA